jgi:hypothetical protein
MLPIFFLHNVPTHSLPSFHHLFSGCQTLFPEIKRLDREGGYSLLVVPKQSMRTAQSLLSHVPSWRRAKWFSWFMYHTWRCVLGTNVAACLLWLGIGRRWLFNFMPRPLCPGDGPQLLNEQETRRGQYPLWTLHTKCFVRSEVPVAMTVHITGLMRGVMSSILVASSDMSEIFCDSFLTAAVLVLYHDNLVQGRRIFLRARAQIFYKIRRNYLECPWEFRRA